MTFAHGSRSGNYLREGICKKEQQERTVKKWDDQSALHMHEDVLRKPLFCAVNKF